MFYTRRGGGWMILKSQWKIITKSHHSEYADNKSKRQTNSKKIGTRWFYHKSRTRFNHFSPNADTVRTRKKRNPARLSSDGVLVPRKGLEPSHHH